MKLQHALLPRFALLAAGLAAAITVGNSAFAQGGPNPPPVRSPRDNARADFTGYWTAVVSEDWRWRMVAPLKGDLSNIPANTKARAAAEAWDLARDEAAGVQCRAYGAPALLREPAHLHISWRDDTTLQLEVDSGQQSRLLHFNAAASAGPPSLQGDSLAQWEAPLRTPFGAGLALGLAPRGGNQSKTLQVSTRNLAPGYLRKNGVPYSGAATMSEYFDLFRDPDGTRWFVVTSIVEDPEFLNAPWVTTQHFRELKDGASWQPTPCSLR
jgi:hypothetical protein